MLYFSNADQINQAYPSASRFATQIGASGLTIVETIRRAVTQDFNKYTRRNWEYAASILEYFDAPELHAGEVFRVYLEKQPRDLNVPLSVSYSSCPTWSNPVTLVEGTDYFWNDTHKRIDIVAMKRVHQTFRAYKVQYAGGFKPLQNIDLDDTDQMDCVGEYASLDQLALSEACYRLEMFISRNQAQDQVNIKQERLKVKPQRGGMLSEVAFRLDYYKRPLAIAT